MDSKSKRTDADVSRRTVLTGAGALTGAAVLGGITAAGGGADDSSDTDDESGTEGGDESADPITIAHRGFGGLYPENTLAAMRGSVQADADAIEIDLMPCADGTPIVFHDPQLSGRSDGGLTDAKGVVWEMDCGVVDAAEVRETDQTVPRLSICQIEFISKDECPISLGDPAVDGDVRVLGEGEQSIIVTSETVR